jgi:hypothetical protein
LMRLTAAVAVSLIKEGSRYCKDLGPGMVDLFIGR